MTVVKTITLVNGFVQSGTAGTVDTADITADAVTYPKLVNIAAGKLLGSVAGAAADPGEVSIGSGLTLSGGVLSALQTTSAIWRLDTTSTTMANPGSGKVRFNSATPSAVTALAISATTDGGTDATNLLKSLTSGDGIYLQDQSNSANWVRYDLTGAVTNNTTWFQVPVALHGSSSGGSLPTNNSPLLCTFTTSGAGAAGAATQAANTVYAGPTSGAAAAPTFRALVAADCPAITAAKLWGSVSGSTAAPGEVTVGTGLSLSGGTLTASGGSVFGPAGGSHAAGLVPDPGATAHTNIPWVLGDGAIFLLPYGRLLGVNSVSADQSTSSTSYGQFGTTPDSVTFNVDAGTYVFLVLYVAKVYNSNASVSNRDILLFGGVSDSGSAADVGITVANTGFTEVILFRKSVTVSSGSYTVECQHAVTSGTGHWYGRTLAVFLSP